MVMPEIEVTNTEPTLNSRWNVRPVYREILVVLLFIVVIAANFPELVLYKMMPTGGDVNGLCYPQLHFLGQELRSGNYPFWNPHLLSGTPYFANIHTGAAHWPHLIFFLLFPAAQAFGLDLAFHFFLAGWFTYLLTRLYGLRRSSAFFAGLCFMFSEFMISKMLVTAFFFSIPFFVFLLYGIEYVFVKRNFRSLLLCGFALESLLLCGYPQTVYITACTVAVYVIVRGVIELCRTEAKDTVKIGHRVIGNILISFFIGSLLLLISYPLMNLPLHQAQLLPVVVISGLLALTYAGMVRLDQLKLYWKSLLVILGFLALALVIGSGLAAFQLVPALKNQAASLRANFPESEYVRIVELLRFLPAVVADFFTGGGMGDFEISGYIGTVSILLMLGSLFIPFTQKEHRPYVYLLGILICGSLSIVFFEPYLYHHVFLFIPKFTTFLAVHRFLLVTNLALAVLAGFALEQFLLWKSETTVIHSSVLGFVLFSFGCFILLNGLHLGNLGFRLIPGFLIILFFLLSPGKMFHPLIFSTAVCLLVLFELRPETARYANQIQFMEQSDIYSENPSVQLLNSDQGFFRYYAIENPNRKEPAFGEARLTRLLLPNCGQVYGLYDTQGYDPIYKTIYRDYVDHANNNQPQRNPYNDPWHYAVLNPSDSKLISMLNVKYIISETPLDVPDYKLIQDGPEKVYLNPATMPRAWLTHQVRVTREEPIAWQWMMNQSFNPRKTAVLHNNYGKLIEQRSNLIGQTGRKFPANHVFHLRAASPGYGDLLQIFVDGNETLDETQGYILAVLNSTDGEFEALQNFRTDQSPDEIQRMMSLIVSLDTEKIVLVMARGNANQYMTADQMSTFQLIGAKGEFRPSIPDHSALVILGVKGAKPGEAIELNHQSVAETVIPFTLPSDYRYDLKELIGEDSRKAYEEIETAGDNIAITRYQPNAITYQVNAAAPGILVASEIYDAGWSVSVDNKESRCVRVNGALRGVYVPAGKHLVEYSYLPVGFTQGAWISVMTFLLLLLSVGIRIDFLYRKSNRKKLEQQLLKKVDQTDGISETPKSEL